MTSDHHPKETTGKLYRYSDPVYEMLYVDSEETLWEKVGTFARERGYSTVQNYYSTEPALSISLYRPGKVDKFIHGIRVGQYLLIRTPDEYGVRNLIVADDLSSFEEA